ncbi:multidrug transporter [Subsaxibacter sp. CAU 1640]|uniref:multidrug transporter n=1 Tax=Subsaxibacter sp. CAU 1640 TaxID=2933271 RepID=UPI002004D26F|nr:multidrug transporter [Subsaxibacter sp. CAU 1640]MCK7589249.1 multidrug transporter [Subsaxibacter sp. CAU 1640]
MKTNLFFLLAFALIFMGCESDDTSDIIINDNSVTNNNGGGSNPSNDCINLSGVYTSDLTLDANNCYVVNGPLLMTEGTTLTIPAGMTIKVAPVGVNAYIAILRGATIIADGNAANPIVFTSNAASPASGNWGGVVICGNAPINSTADGSTDTATTEVGGLSYGGNTPNDNSGIIRYVRIEYAGGAIDGNAELNGLSLYAVGSGTTIDYVQAYKGSDDGFEFFGGTVNASHLSVVDAEDDSIDWTEGFMGTLTDIYVKQNAGSDHDSGFEMDGFNTDFSNEGGYVSQPTVTNVTVIGDGDSGRAFRLRAGTAGIFTNIMIDNFGRGVVLEDDQMDYPTSQNVVDGNLSMTDVFFSANVTTAYTGSGLVNPVTQNDVILGNASNATGTDYATWGAGWTIE